MLVLLAGQHAGALPLPADGTTVSFPENSYARHLYLDRIMGPMAEARSLAPDVIVEPGHGHQVQFFVEENEDTVYFCFYHGTDIEFSRPVTGSVVLQRSRREGDLRKIKIFYKDEPNSYLSITPGDGDRCAMDIMLLNYPIQQGIRLPYPIEEAAKKPVTGIMRDSAAYVDWDFYIPREEFPLQVLTDIDDLVFQIRPYLRQLKDVEDGALDSAGRFVFIEDGSLQPNQNNGGLNCSGFAKWVIDGVLYPHTGRLLEVEPLKRPHPDFRGNRWSEKVDSLEDPYFGLDWTRNLAVEAMKVFSAAPEEPGPEDADVDFLRYHDYKDDVGYPIGRLKTVLYELARTHPNRFYLASVNDLEHGGYELRKHHHVAVLFPWLDDRGGLQVSVMERAQETNLDAFMENYRKTYVHLVQIDHSGVFKPGQMRLEPVIKR